MKTNNFLQLLIVAVFSSLVFISCSQEDLNFNTEQTNIVNGPLKVKSGNTEYCGTPLTVDLLAGQTIVSGNVTVANDEENLYVTYSTQNGWLLSQIHLYVGANEGLPVNKAGNPTIGQFPYKVAFNPYVTTYTYTLPLSSFPDVMTIAAHAVVVKTDASGKVLQSETGWGKGISFAKSWAMKFVYTKQVCVVLPPVEQCYQTETAWTTGDRYTTTGNWATYTTYAPGTKDIYAGQTIPVGTVTFSSISSNNTVTLSIALTNGWTLNQETSESVKIQGYNTAPSGNPSPGLFTTYKGTNLTVTVPANEYYGIHLDVALPIACE